MTLPANKSMRPNPPQTIDWPFVREEDRAVTEGSGHLHWTIQAYMKRDDDGAMHDVVAVDVEAPDELSAIARAQGIVMRAGYRVANVRETCTLDKSLKEEPHGD